MSEYSRSKGQCEIAIEQRLARDIDVRNCSRGVTLVRSVTECQPQLFSYREQRKRCDPQWCIGNRSTVYV